jgi:hypothetical protein
MAVEYVIEKKRMYWIRCSNHAACNNTTEKFNDEDGAINNAVSLGWEEDSDDWYCPQCKGIVSETPRKHYCCNWPMPLDQCGKSDCPAIGLCYEQNGELWVDNGVNSSQVNFCPYCGYQAKRPIKGKMFAGRQDNG